VIGEILHNFGNIRQLDLSIGVAYDTDVNKAVRAIEELLRQHRHVLQEPVPLVGVVGFADSAITISVRPWVPVPHYSRTQVELNQAILERFRRDNISIPFPQHEVRLLNPT
jgi:small conductance mechanosensitive channel